MLGLDLPRVDEQRARRYLADPDVGILIGSLSLVHPPTELRDDPMTALARMRIISASPALMQRQAARFAPIAHEVQELIALKLATLPGAPTDPASIQATAATIASLSAALFIQPGEDGTPSFATPPADPARRLADLRWVWDRLV